MDNTQITLVQDSFGKVKPIAREAAKVFYDRLFEIAPHTRAYFQGDMDEQGMKLMTTLGVVVNGLRHLEAVVPVAQDLAVKHVAYGVKADDYKHVGAALLYTLKAGLGDDFDAETEAAWTTAYTILSTVMTSAAYGSAAE